jgi:transposase
VLASIRRLYPWLRHIFADGGYAGDKLRHALLAFGRWTVQIIKRSDAAQGFEVLPRRWVVTACTMLPKCGTSGRQRSIAAFCASRVGVTADQLG